MTRRTGFTLIELVLVMTIVGLLSSIAVPKFQDVRRRARATRIIGDFDAVRIATMNFYVDSSYYPDEADAGTLPDNLAPYLPVNFTMRKPGWTLDYEHWVTVAITKTKAQAKGKGKGLGVSKTSKTESVVALSFTTFDKALGRTAMRMVSGTPTYIVGNKYTFLIHAF